MLPLLLNQPVVQKQLSGTLTFLENVGACPVAIFLCRADASVHRLQIGAPIELSSDIVAVAVTPPLATGLDVLKMPTRMFQATPDPNPSHPTADPNPSRPHPNPTSSSIFQALGLARVRVPFRSRVRISEPQP